MPLLEKEIRQLPEAVIQKIAAGEVIERPASVLKELIENCIDAEAAKIDIAVENGGYSLIRVADNGAGMSQGNLEKSVLRHATSKISRAEDIYALSTMGFRGEALASIASVSRLRITSSSSDGGLGAALSVEGTGACACMPAPHVRGTTVEVRDIFFNTPARRKFMKSEKAERMAMMRMLEEVVIAFPGIHFTGLFDGNRVFEVPPAETLPMRIAQVAGNEFAHELIECNGSVDGMGVTLYLTPPGTKGASASRPRWQNLYVNLRRVDNTTVNAAIRQGFARFITEQFRPAFFCFLDVDPHKIDVNVHPTKKEVKFDDERALFALIYSAIQRFLSAAITGPMGKSPPGNAADPVLSPAYPHSLEFASRPYLIREDAAQSPVAATPIPDDAAQTMLRFSGLAQMSAKSLDPGLPNTIQFTDNAAVTNEMWSLISCYQIHETYILAPIKNGILLIDQHAAHERILYEQALKDLETKRSTSQQLLFPLVLELTPTEKTVVDSSSDYFRAFGFDIQDFGGTTISVMALPAFLKDSAALQAIKEMVRLLIEDTDVKRISEPHRRFAAAFACGAAIKAGQALDKEEMNGLLNSLFAAENPYTCPHGRPTVVRISLDELSRRFLR